MFTEKREVNPKATEVNPGVSVTAETSLRTKRKSINQSKVKETTSDSSVGDSGQLISERQGLSVRLCQ